jgi:hypothetical protein
MPRRPAAPARQAHEPSTTKRDGHCQAGQTRSASGGHRRRPRVTARKISQLIGPGNPFRTPRRGRHGSLGARLPPSTAQFDADVRFSNGGGLRADGSRVDVPGPDVTEQDVAALFAASLNLLTVDTVELPNLSVFAEPHKDTRGGPSDHPAAARTGRERIAGLSHPIRDT